MEKYFVTYKQAVALKEIGYNKYSWFGMECSLYKADGNHTFYANGIGDETYISAPLKSQVFEWARKEYRIISVIDFYCDNDEWEDTMYEVRISEFKHFKTHDSFVQSEYKSYEEAELACIDKLIEIIKTK